MYMYMDNFFVYYSVTSLIIWSTFRLSIQYYMHDFLQHKKNIDITFSASEFNCTTDTLVL